MKAQSNQSNQLFISEVNEIYLKRGEKKITVAGAITSPDDAVSALRQLWNDDIEIYESVFIMILDVSNNIIGWAKISQGGIASSLVDARLVAKIAIETLASGVILAHNHPSGQLKFSDADIRLTKTIEDGLALFNIKLLDHIVLTPENYISYKS